MRQAADVVTTAIVVMSFVGDAVFFRCWPRRGVR